MQSSQRQRVLMIALIGTLVLCAVYPLVLSPFLDMRDQLLLQRDTGNKELAEAHRILALQEELRPLSRSMASSLSGDPSAVESRLLHLLHEWQQRAGVSNASFQRLRSVDSHGFTCLTFSVSASGGMAPIASLLFNIETASVPLRIEDVRLTPKRDGADELQMRLNVSTLCRAGTPNSAGGTAVAKADATGGEQ